MQAQASAFTQLFQDSQYYSGGVAVKCFTELANVANGRLPRY